MPEPADHPPSLRDRLADALYEWAVGHTTGGARFLAGGTDKPLRENSLARADAILPVVEAETAALRQRIEEAERALAQARDAIADERRGRLAAEAAVRRAWEVARNRIAVPTDVLLDALTIEQPKETP